jgi:transcription-repair coupling factor (superfamily II helicase)
MCCFRPRSSKAGSTSQREHDHHPPRRPLWPRAAVPVARPRGPGKLRAYAYLTTAADKALTEIAEKRLKVLGDLDSLGAGFQLASHDLDIRGAGNLLGDEQSGHIARWASSCTSRCWKRRSWQPRRATMGLERDSTKGLSPQITVDAPIMIPEDYVPDLAVRMALYRRLNDAEDPGEVEALSAEMIDRFGPCPRHANLVQLIQIKRQAIEAHIAKIDVGAKGTLVSFHNDSFPDPAGLVAYAARGSRRPDNKLVVQPWGDPKARLNGLQLTKPKKKGRCEGRRPRAPFMLERGGRSQQSASIAAPQAFMLRGAAHGIKPAAPRP